jgi:hypothetical protein
MKRAYMYIKEEKPFLFRSLFLTLRVISEINVAKTFSIIKKEIDTIKFQ